MRLCYVLTAIFQPTIHFKPTEARKKQAKGFYACPTYYYPIRSTSFVVSVDLKSGKLLKMIKNDILFYIVYTFDVLLF